MLGEICFLGIRTIGGTENHRMSSRLRAGTRGIPLVEVLVVVFVIGSLASVVVPKLLDVERKAVDLAVKSDLRIIATHLSMLQLDASSVESRFAAPILTLGDAKLTLAPGNTPRLFRKGKDRFCVQVTNPGATDPSRGLVWKLDAGGLQPTGQTCAGYRATLL